MNGAHTAVLFFLHNRVYQSLGRSASGGAGLFGGPGRCPRCL